MTTESDNLYWEIRIKHGNEHREHPDRRDLISFDKACLICHPKRTIPGFQFLRFFDWVKSVYPVTNYSGLTEQYFEQAVENFDNNQAKQADDNIIRITYSLTYDARFNLDIVHK